MATKLHDKHQKLVVIVDAGIKASNDYPYYKDGSAQGCFIKSMVNSAAFNGDLIGEVWPKQAAFPDWFNPCATTIWHNGLEALYKSVNYDGLWTDMNEVTSFCNGECPNNPPPMSRHTESASLLSSFFNRKVKLGGVTPLPAGESTYDIPYNLDGNLDNMTISLNGTHSNGLLEYDVHSLFGAMEMKATHDFLVDSSRTNPGSDRIPMILSRSTFPGAG